MGFALHLGHPVNPWLKFCAGLLVAAAPAVAFGEAETHIRPTAAPAFSELPPAIPLWASGAPGSPGQASPPKTYWESYTTPAGLTTWYAAMTSINTPAIIPFRPAPGKSPATAVVVCPGGGHRFLAMEHEGYSVGQWLSAHGVAVFVLEYRLARAPDSTYQVREHSLMDVQRAIRTVRAHATEWNVDPARVGVMGFSAGGEVAALAASEFEHPVKTTGDAVDALDCRPDFQALFYPGMPTPVPTPTPRTPPAFLCGAFDDGFKLTTPMARYYLALADAGVPTEMHIYARGGHGFGIRDEDRPVYSWMGLFIAWLSTIGSPPAP